MRVSLAELKTEPVKYIGLADKQDIYVTEGGRAIARITSAKPEGKVEAALALFGILPSDADLDSAREGHFGV
ncbi:MAG: type II toxin-antitoxin system Phd/YefM family antitoxin [Synergistaceae bacterium]|nr:type II toxin-antitoxin system Phd/YefM family antitoxin [Synergistaceae bacterium]